MDYSFVRKLVKNISKENANAIYKCFVTKGIELFVTKGEAFSNITLENLDENIDLYVSAADLTYAQMLVKEIGLENYLCNEAETKVETVKSEVELAEEEFYRKHKQNQLFAWGIILLVIGFIIVQFLGM